MREMEVKKGDYFPTKDSVEEGLVLVRGISQRKGIWFAVLSFQGIGFRDAHVYTEESIRKLLNPDITLRKIEDSEIELPADERVLRIVGEEIERHVVKHGARA